MLPGGKSYPSPADLARVGAALPNAYFAMLGLPSMVAPS